MSQPTPSGREPSDPEKLANSISSSDKAAPAPKPEPDADQDVAGAVSQESRPAMPRERSSMPPRPPAFTPDGKRIITEEECEHVIGYSWPSWKKWMLLSSIFAVQMSMNFNTSVYPSVVTPLSIEFGVSEQAARAGQCAFLVAYAFGCELWAPWSEEFGRWPILQ